MVVMTYDLWLIRIAKTFKNDSSRGLSYLKARATAQRLGWQVSRRLKAQK